MALMEDIPPTTLVPNASDILKDLRGYVMRAVKARAAQLIEEAETMTVSKVRRLIEKDLNLEENFLNAHKDIVKESIDKAMNGPEAESPRKRKIEKSDAEQTNERELEVESITNGKHIMKRLKKKSNVEEIKEENVEDQVAAAGNSNVENGDTKDHEEDSLGGEKEDVDIEGLVREAACKRASDFRSQAENMTLAGVRRLLEKDLKLEKGGLDAHKQFIRKLLDELLNTEEEKEPVAVKASKKRKTTALESEKVQGGTKRKEKLKKVVKKQKIAPVKEEDDSEEHDEDEEPVDEEDSESENSDDDETARKKSQKPKVEAKPVYSRKVENLKKIIKACGMTVPPNVYKKVKQAPEEQREGALLKELEAILHREGLSAGASKDEIKSVRKRKEKLKDLEGIDSSNIIVESRGRRAAALATDFFAPKRTEAVDLGDEDEEEEEQESDSEEDPDVEPQDDDEED